MSMPLLMYYMCVREFHCIITNYFVREEMTGVKIMTQVTQNIGVAAGPASPAMAGPLFGPDHFFAEERFQLLAYLLVL